MNLVTGIQFKATFPIFVGSFKSPKFSHNVEIEAIIQKESYGAEKGQHTFSFEVLNSSDLKEFEIGKIYRKKGRNMYPNIQEIIATPENMKELESEKEFRASSQSAKSKRQNGLY